MQALTCTGGLLTRVLASAQAALLVMGWSPPASMHLHQHMGGLRPGAAKTTGGQHAPNSVQHPEQGLAKSKSSGQRPVASVTRGCLRCRQ